MKRFAKLSLIAFVFAMPHFAVADDGPPACKGQNLYDDLKTSDPQGFASVEKEAAATLNHGPLYWKITPANGAGPSYLLGTAHVTDSRIAEPSKTLIDRVAKSRVAVFELAEGGDKQGLGAAMLNDIARTRMPIGQVLWDVIPDDKEAAIRNNPMIAGLPMPVVEQFQPWLIMTMLSSPLCEQVRSQTKFVLDAALSQQAQVNTVPIEGLETVSEQLEVMSGMSLKDQADMLVSQSERGIAPEDTLATLTELYVSRNVTAMDPLLRLIAQKKGVAETAKDKTFMDNFLTKRNHTMAERARKYLDKGEAFIAVGALHLYGEEGVVELLRKAGYKVEAAE
jgi:uncharacterized protein